MGKSAPLDVRLESSLNDRIAAVAKALDRSTSWVTNRAVEDFVSLQEWQLAAIDEGIAAAEAGRVVSHDDVVAWVASWGEPDELPAPKCE